MVVARGRAGKEHADRRRADETDDARTTYHLPLLTDWAMPSPGPGGRCGRLKVVIDINSRHRPGWSHSGLGQ